jgi:hypothetical protein
MVFPPTYSCVNSQAPRSNDNCYEIRVLDSRFKVFDENYGGPREKKNDEPRGGRLYNCGGE